jgi:formylglycine-generating enzyme required for sulfatase activity
MNQKQIVFSVLLLLSMTISACGLSVQPTVTLTATPVPVTSTSEVTLTPTLTPIPTALPSEITDVQGVPMRLVPAGEFTMGSENGDEDEKPVHKVTLDAFYIDVYEVTNARYKTCVDAGGCIPPPKFEGRFYNYYKAGYDDYPVDAKDWNCLKCIASGAEPVYPRRLNGKRRHGVQINGRIHGERALIKALPIMIVR